MRILYVGTVQGFGNADKFYMIPQRLVNGLTRAGHNVYCFNDRDWARSANVFGSSKLGIGFMNRALVKACQDFYPELIILAHCTHVKNETLEEIRTLITDVKIVYRNVDQLDDDDNIKRIMNRVDWVDGIFVTTAGKVLHKFSSKKTFSAFFPNPVDASIDVGRAFEQETYKADLFFAASSIGKEDHRETLVVNIMRALRDSPIIFDIVGAGLNRKRLFGINYMKQMLLSRTGLIANKTENHYLYASDRMSQYMGNGLMIYASATPRYTDIFSTEEIVIYEGYEDLAEKILYYHHHDEERRRIASRGHAKAHKIFNESLVAQYFIDMTFDRMEGKVYPWPFDKFTGKNNSDL